ncbi:hypothetical protein PRUPE_2G234500 [Prunus persica]|uniref:Uncharacterized protein n=1 Tax=Prunus persica TaxID=3760 RepID=A0A251QKM3_PRUPE|nr:hypothetical protein PRUPE_2G234500 [Prunus persica]ONI24338.1 hypothetical protein PRUPE_2G234500 [Prunus persica]
MTHIWQMFKPLHFQAFPSVVGWVGSYGGNGMSNIDHFIQDFEINLCLSLSSHVLQVRIDLFIQFDYIWNGMDISGLCCASCCIDSFWGSVHLVFWCPLMLMYPTALRVKISVFL